MRRLDSEIDFNLSKRTRLNYRTTDNLIKLMKDTRIKSWCWSKINKAWWSALTLFFPSLSRQLMRKVISQPSWGTKRALQMTSSANLRKSAQSRTWLTEIFKRIWGMSGNWTKSSELNLIASRKRRTECFQDWEIRRPQERIFQGKPTKLMPTFLEKMMSLESLKQSMKVTATDSETLMTSLK